jgi:energy-coupling factor transporter ATP-binding protein EcfA2
MNKNFYKLDSTELFTTTPEHSSLPVKRLILQKYGTGTAAMSLKGKFEPQVVERIIKEGGQLISSSKNDTHVEALSSINQQNFWTYLIPSRKSANETYIFFKDIIVNVYLETLDRKESVSDTLETYAFDNDDSGVGDVDKDLTIDNFAASITLHIPADNFNSAKDLSFINEYKIDEKKGHNISILIKNQYGEYDFEPLNITVPGDMNLELNYGGKFENVHTNIVDKLNKNDKGLYLFHGPPGTGKTTYIKYLTSIVKKDFIFVPTSMLDRFINDPDVLGMMVRRKRAVLVLEDAEKILMSREAGDNPFISTLLNLSDGIMADILKTAIIVTFNSNEKTIDKAIKRKGRTMIDYKFEKLAVDEAHKLAKSLKFKKEHIEEIKEAMTLTDIYNLKDQNSFLEKEEDEEKFIGFRTK